MQTVVRAVPVLCALALWSGVAAPASAQVYPSRYTAPGSASVRYFDAHNHFTGVLPYYAYADLPAFERHAFEGGASVGIADRLALYRYFVGVWYPAYGVKLGDKRFSPPDGQRFAPGARAALLVYRRFVAHDPADLNGVLERVLTATPWSEFDSAYAFRGGPASEYLRQRFYDGDAARLTQDLCRATVLDLAATHITISEQSMPFVGGWRLRDGRSGALDTIECAMHLGSDAGFEAELARAHADMPIVKFVLMTHTADLARSAAGTHYDEWSKTGRCAPVPLPPGLTTPPHVVYEALLGRDAAGKLVVPAADLARYEDTVLGIDTAGPETTCFSSEGMAYYERLIGAVYDAAKVRRSAGWHGKLLVHTHVGEGAAIDYAPEPPPLPWSFASMFAHLPRVRSNAEQARANISALLAAIAAFERAHPDTASYVVFRLAHATWADDAQATAMHDEGVEADVNLESNVATGAYPLSRMPMSQSLLMRLWIQPAASNEATNLGLNDLLDTLLTDPNDERQVGGILGNTSLKYLLENHVRCLLGTDADGVEHSDIVKEYEYASSLIAYWSLSDPVFRARAGDASVQTLFDDVRWHLASMSADAPLPY